MDKVAIDDDGCWIWTGYLDKDGYGRAASSPWEPGGRRWRGVHAWVWEHHHGLIPEGLQPDHTCEVKACCNPDHIVLATPKENIARRDQGKTRCPQGHAYDEANTYRDPSGRRHCRKCMYAYKIKRRKLLGRVAAG
jgi:hypothetical protein